jgi:shikimate dehydrogenase
MQEAGFRAAGLDWTYQILDVSPGDLPAAMAAIHCPPVVGSNVTIPHKLAVIPHLDALDPEAVAAGSVNTIVRDGDRLIGHNTDVVGIRRALTHVGLVDPVGRRVVVLGSGGSARAAAVASAGADQIFVARRPDEVPKGGHWVEWGSSESSHWLATADVVINATPLGRHEDLPVSMAQLRAQGAVIDLVYIKGGTRFVRDAQAAGRRWADGWDMLVWQGAASFKIWTGLEAPETVMRAALAT